MNKKQIVANIRGSLDLLSYINRESRSWRLQVDTEPRIQFIRDQLQLLLGEEMGKQEIPYKVSRQTKNKKRI